MRRLLLIPVAAVALAAVTLAGCNMNTGKRWYQDPDAIAAAQSVGYTSVIEWRPNFICQSAMLGQPIVPVANGDTMATGQHGHFLTATASDGRHVRLLLCEGLHMPPRVQEMAGGGATFAPLK